MRTIRFRGKRLTDGRWVYGDLIHADKGLVNIWTHDAFGNNPEDVDECGEEVSVDLCTIGQYTGLHDKNGREIHEGDILRIPLLDPIFGDMISDAFDNAPVSFHNGAFVVAYYEGWYKIYLQDLSDKVEVIGNIYDNPKLLEGDNE